MTGDKLEQLLSTDVTYVNVVDGTYCETRVDRIFVFNKTFSTQDHRMMFDTVANGIYLPRSIHMAAKEFPGIRKQKNRAYVSAFESWPFLPPVAFQIQAITFKILPKLYTKQETVF
ncbi:hypothetical protein CLF_106209 [Clonorchis sinensis]|uniref:Peptidase A1 domain-containing protein n=1 Tax=Clonorchis sinensis TaxID=79923 RepID=G7YET5_CLOSI|nr:hypothetical protein CLF_106209 [Clonorchis sinensis]